MVDQIAVHVLSNDFLTECNFWEAERVASQQKDHMSPFSKTKIEIRNQPMVLWNSYHFQCGHIGLYLYWGELEFKQYQETECAAVFTTTEPWKQRIFHHNTNSHCPEVTDKTTKYMSVFTAGMNQTTG